MGCGGELGFISMISGSTASPCLQLLSEVVGGCSRRADIILGK